MLPVRVSLVKLLNKRLAAPTIKLCRNHGTVFKSYEVPQYCTLNIKCTYNVQVKPLDQLVYLDNNLLRIKINSSDTNLKCDINYNDIQIKDDIKNVPEDLVCEIEAPVKANLYVDTDRNISIGNFHGEIIDLKSNRGNIAIEKTHSERVTVICNRGNIVCKGIVQANNISLLTARNGNITTDRLQGNHLKVETENGDIKVHSSYCDNSIFETQRGKIDLQNPHKSNQIIIHNEGNLNIFGLDGRIVAFVNKGNVDIQIARILEDSNITMNEGKLYLKLSESVQDDTVVEVLSKYFLLDNNINLTLQRSNDLFSLLPLGYNKEKNFNKIVVDCKNSNLTLETANWSEMFKYAMGARK